MESETFDTHEESTERPMTIIYDSPAWIRATIGARHIESAGPHRKPGATLTVRKFTRRPHDSTNE